MVDFAEGISDRTAGRHLSQSLQGRGAFRRFKNLIYEQYPELISAWHALRDARAQRRAVAWLLDEGLVDGGGLAAVCGRAARILASPKANVRLGAPNPCHLPAASGQRAYRRQGPHLLQPRARPNTDRSGKYLR